MNETPEQLQNGPALSSPQPMHVGVTHQAKRFAIAGVNMSFGQLFTLLIRILAVELFILLILGAVLGIPAIIILLVL